jgi:hypothetical protein
MFYLYVVLFFYSTYLFYLFIDGFSFHKQVKTVSVDIFSNLDLSVSVVN